MNCYFSELGRRVYARWQEANFSLTSFPEIARTALEEQSPSEEVDLAALIREFLLYDEQPYQSSSGFGQPEIIVYDSPKFISSFSSGSMEPQTFISTNSPVPSMSWPDRASIRSMLLRMHRI